MKNILKEKGYKITPARLAILEIFAKDKLPMDAESIYKKLRSRKYRRKINGVTVYRTLSSLEKSGILKKVDFRKDSTYFELADKHHHHIICTECDKIEDFASRILERVLHKIASQSLNFKIIRDHSLELFGLCRICQLKIK